MIEQEAGCLSVKVPMIMANARDLLAAGCAALVPGEQVIDCSAVTEADSSAIAVMLGWLRAAGETQSTVKFSHLPDTVRVLAELYGVTELLPLA